MSREYFLGYYNTPKHNKTVISYLYYMKLNISILAELGDHEDGHHTPALISEFRFVQNQNEEFELDVLEAYKKLR